MHVCAPATVSSAPYWEAASYCDAAGYKRGHSAEMSHPLKPCQYDVPNHKLSKV